MARFCMKCGTALREGAKFCSRCGVAVAAGKTPKQESPKGCPQCGVAFKEGAKFCLKCGARLGSGSIGASSVSEPVLVAKITDQPPNVDAAQTSIATTQDTPVVKEAVHLANKALSVLLDQTINASDKAGEMNIAMTDAQKSLITTVIREIGKRIGK